MLHSTILPWLVKEPGSIICRVHHLTLRASRPFPVSQNVQPRPCSYSSLYLCASSLASSRCVGPAALGDSSSQLQTMTEARLASAGVTRFAVPGPSPSSPLFSFGLNRSWHGWFLTSRPHCPMLFSPVCPTQNVPNRCNLFFYQQTFHR